MRSHNRTSAILKWSAALGAMVLGTQVSHADTYCLGSSNQVKGTANGYYYELWNPSTDANQCMSVNAGATYSGTWNMGADYLARRGIYWGATGQTWKQRGGYLYHYGANWQPTFVTGGNSSIGIYGWFHRVNNKGTTAEFYIVEDYYQWNHSQDSTAKSLGLISVNGVLYEVIKTQRPDGSDSPYGPMSFPQYVSVRRDRGTNQNPPVPSPAGVIGGNIDIGQHFAAWEKLGLDLGGELAEISFLSEAQGTTGTVDVSTLDISTITPPTSIAFSQSSYTMNVDDQILLDWTYSPADYGLTDVMILSTNSSGTCNNVNLWAYQGKWIMTGMTPGTCTLTIYSPDGMKSGTATVTVGSGAQPFRVVQTRALGTKGGEQIYLTRDGKRFNSGYTLSTSFQTFTETVYGDGELALEYVNDDAVPSGRDVRVDYVMVDGIKRETEAMPINTGFFANGRCGGGGYSEWLNCAGKVSYGALKQEHTITIRARGTTGGEHIQLLINGVSQGSGWWLGTAFQEYTANYTGDGDINVKYDNDGGTRDVVVDWLRVDSQNPRQSENMQYNTAVFANGRCGGGSYSEWMHCNGVIGYGKLSDNFN